MADHTPKIPQPQKFHFSVPGGDSLLRRGAVPVGYVTADRKATLNQSSYRNIHRTA